MKNEYDDNGEFEDISLSLKRITPENPKTNADRFLHYRMMCGLSQQTIANATEISRNTYRALENGTREADTMDLRFYKKFLTIIDETASEKKIQLDYSHMENLLSGVLNFSSISELKSAGFSPRSLKNILKIKNRSGQLPNSKMEVANKISTLDAILSNENLGKILSIISQWAFYTREHEYKLKLLKDLEKDLESDSESDLENRIRNQELLEKYFIKFRDEEQLVKNLKTLDSNLSNEILLFLKDISNEIVDISSFMHMYENAPSMHSNLLFCCKYHH